MVFFFAVLGRLLSRSAWGRAFVCTVDDLSRRLIQQAVFKGVLGVVLLPVGQYGLLVALFRFRSIRALAPAMCSGCGPCAHTPAVARLLPVGEYAEPMPIGNAQAGGYRIEIVELSTFYLTSRLNRL